MPNVIHSQIFKILISIFILICEIEGFIFANSICSNDSECRSLIDTQFYLHTREAKNLNKNYVITARNLENSLFNPSRPTKFIVHSHLDSGDSFWLLKMANALLIYGDYNVIRVDWRKGSRTLYSKATANTRIVGLEISNFVNILAYNQSVDPANVHCIGHSLGAHVCGYAGENIRGLGRITGLDPLGSGYFKSKVEINFLDPSDAEFVDVIHTINEPKKMKRRFRSFGNLDFLPNSGRGQPGCGLINNIKDLFSLGSFVDSVRNLFFCSHMRAIDYFISSLQSSNCQFVAYMCSSYEAFNAGQCASCGEDNSKCAFLGIRADEYVNKSAVNARFYIKTNSDEPYCVYHYVVSISVTSPRCGEFFTFGKLYITVYGKNGVLSDSIFLQVTDWDKPRTLLLTNTIDIEDIERLDLTWLGCPFDPLCQEYLCVQNIKISPISNYPESLRLSKEVTACGALDRSHTRFSNTVTRTFYVRDNCPQT